MKKIILALVLFVSVGQLSAQSPLNGKLTLEAGLLLSSGKAVQDKLDYNGLGFGFELGAEYLILDSWGVGVKVNNTALLYSSDAQELKDVKFEAYGLRGFLATTSYTLFPKDYFQIFASFGGGMYRVQIPELKDGEKVTQQEQNAFALGFVPEIGFTAGDTSISYTLTSVGEATFADKTRISQNVSTIKLAYKFRF